MYDLTFVLYRQSSSDHTPNCMSGGHPRSMSDRPCCPVEFAAPPGLYLPCNPHEVDALGWSAAAAVGAFPLPVRVAQSPLFHVGPELMKQLKTVRLGIAMHSNRQSLN